MRFLLDELPIGRIDESVVELVAELLPMAKLEGEAMCWRPGSDDPALRSAQIQAAALSLRQSDVIHGWRDERYRCERPVADPCLAFGAELFQLERAAFRFFGLMSRAVHVNGFSEDGRVWCGRRSMSKAIDPGRLDSLAAGGLPAGESLLDCARRELFEEAGVPTRLAVNLEDKGAVRTRRKVQEGWHDEVLHVFDLRLPVFFTPANQDGEVSEFLLIDPEAFNARVGEFTEDAVAAMRHSLLQAGR